MRTYIEAEFDELKLDDPRSEGFKCSLQIVSQLGRTKWLSATKEQVEEIEKILNENSTTERV